MLVQDREGTGSAVGLLVFVTMLPSCLAPLTGAVVDRIERRGVLVACEVVQGALGVALVLWLPALAPLLVLLFFKSIAGTIGDIAGRSSIALIVEDDRLPTANAWFGGARQAADVVGPVLGGIIVAVSSVRAALTVDVITFALGVPLLLRLPVLRAARGPESTGWIEDARAGLRYLAGNRIGARPGHRFPHPRVHRWRRRRAAVPRA